MGVGKEIAELRVQGALAVEAVAVDKGELAAGCESGEAVL